jgi:putative SOS response-associated peptidase YedK
MCSIYSMAGSRHSIGGLARQPIAVEASPAVFQLGFDRAAPIIRNRPAGRQLAMARWVASVSSPSRRDMAIGRRCVVPFTAFAEHRPGPGGEEVPVWFALGGAHPSACFAGLAAEGGFAILSIPEANTEIRVVDTRSMPVILTTREEINLWMNLPAAQALQLRQPLRDGMLRVVRHTPEAGWQSVH